MRHILFCCQALDKSDPAMSFFHEWIKYFSPSFEKVTVIALKTGQVELPAHVAHYSLGKETYAHLFFRRILYTARLITYVWKTRTDYDTVFVHMNQEYILAAGILWKLMGKKVYLWYNHYSGSWATDIAARFCTKIFYTSKSAYTARFPHAVQMPVGVNIDDFSVEKNETKRTPVKILFLARISRSKRPHDLIAALAQAPLKGKDWVVRVTGPTISTDDSDYLAECKKQVDDLGLSSHFTFTDGVPFSETPHLYAAHDIFVNCSKSGMYDKTIFEAAASGCIVITSSNDFKEEAGDDFFFTYSDPAELSNKINHHLDRSPEAWTEAQHHLKEIAVRHSLKHLLEKILKEIP